MCVEVELSLYGQIGLRSYFVVGLAGEKGCQSKSATIEPGYVAGNKAHSISELSILRNVILLIHSNDLSLA